MISWDLAVRWDVASRTQKNHILKCCSKKNFLEITFFSENENCIFPLIICLSTSIHMWNSVIPLILFILPGTKIHIFMGLSRFSRYLLQESLFSAWAGQEKHVKVTLVYFYPGWSGLTCPAIRGAGGPLPHWIWEHCLYTASPTLLCRSWSTLHKPSLDQEMLQGFSTWMPKGQPM